MRTLTKFVTSIFVWGEVTLHNTISMLWGNTAYTAHCVMLSGEHLWRYSNKIESVCLRKCPHYHCLTDKVILQYQTFRRACPCPTWWRKNSWHRYGMKKSRHSHPIYSIFRFVGTCLSLCYGTFTPPRWTELTSTGIQFSDVNASRSCRFIYLFAEKICTNEQ